MKSFDVLATVTLDRTLTSDLLDTTSTERKNFETNFVNVVSLIHDLNVYMCIVQIVFMIIIFVIIDINDHVLIHKKLVKIANNMSRDSAFLI